MGFATVSCNGIARAAATLCLMVGLARAQSTDPTEFFESKIRPLLVSKCAACHGDKVKMAGLVLTTAEGFEKGAESGPLVSGTDPAQSRLIRAVRYLDAIKMPPTAKLAADEIRSLEEWVAGGAPWPNAEPAGQAEAGSQAEPSADQSAYWAFQPLNRSPPPQVENESWAANPIDRFIQAKLAQKNLDPAPRAHKLIT